MSQFARIGTLRADDFLITDQGVFGDAWRYELVDGEILAHAAPAPEHGRILAGLIGALVKRLSGGKSGCRPESGSAVVPERRPRDTARIPDALVSTSSPCRSMRPRQGRTRDMTGLHVPA